MFGQIFAKEIKILILKKTESFLDKRLKIIQTGVKYDFMAGRLKWAHISWVQELPKVSA